MIIRIGVMAHETDGLMVYDSETGAVYAVDTVCGPTPQLAGYQVKAQATPVLFAVQHVYANEIVKNNCYLVPIGDIDFKPDSKPFGPKVLRQAIVTYADGSRIIEVVLTENGVIMDSIPSGGHADLVPASNNWLVRSEDIFSHGAIRQVGADTAKIAMQMVRRRENLFDDARLSASLVPPTTITTWKGKKHESQNQ